MRKLMVVALALALAGCGAGPEKAEMTAAEAAPAVAAVADAAARSCMSDADCVPDGLCECPTNTQTGNCTSPGRCEPRE